MALQKQIIPVPFTQGPDTKDDSKQVPFGKLLTLENGYFQTPGELRKMPGFAALSTTYTKQGGLITGGTIAAGTNAASYKNELVMGDGLHLYSYGQDLTKFNMIGQPSTKTVVTVDDSAINRSDIYVPLEITTAPSSPNQLTFHNADATLGDLNQSYPDMAFDPTTGLKCFCWIETSVNNGKTGFYSVVDGTTGTTVVNTLPVGGGALRIKVLYFNGFFVFLYAASDGLGNDGIYYFKASTATPGVLTSSSATQVCLDLNVAAPNFDATVANSRIYLAYNYVTTGIALRYLDTSFVVSAATTNTTRSAAGAIAVWGMASGNIWTSFSNLSTTDIRVFTSNLVLVESGPTSTVDFTGVKLITGIEQAGVATESSIILYSTYTNANTTDKIYYIRYTLGAAITTQSNYFAASVSLASKLFTYNSNYYVLTLFGADATAAQPTLFLYCLNTGNYTLIGSHIVLTGSVVGKVAAGIASDVAKLSVLPEVVNTATGKFQTAYCQQSGVNEIAANSVSWSATFDLTVTPQAVEIANNLHLTGGQLWMYDGVNVVEHGFHLYPDKLAAVVTDTGSIAQGAYQYIAVYAWIDGQGQVHRSAPSLPLSVTVSSGGASQIAVTAATLRVTLKRNAFVEFYRTAPNGTIFYYVGRLFNRIDNAGTLTNTVTYTDTTADVTANPELYTTGGQVENSSAPPCFALATYKSRLIVIPSDNAYSWWFSQQVLPTSGSTVSTPVELSTFFIQNIDQAGGQITGVESMDDKLVLFKEKLPYYVVGDGPAANGTNGEFSPPQPIVSPVGCTNANSITSTPLGLVFQAANSAGIWLLDRSLAASYLGSDVESYNSQSVTSAVAYPGYNQVRFTMSGGVALVYDYYIRQWSVRTNVAAVQACIFQGSFTYLRSSGLVLKESPAVFTDNGTIVSLRIVMSWLQLGAVQGFQRVYKAAILGDYESAHSLTVNVYYDFDPSVAQTTTIVPTATPPYQWRLLLNRQKCESMQIEIFDNQTSGTLAEGFRLSAIAFEVGIKGGINRISAARTFE